MTLQELLAHNEAVRKKKAKEAAMRAAEQAKNTVTAKTEEKIETESKSKKGRKPKNRAYLVAEDLSFTEDDAVAKIVEEDNIAEDDGDSKLEKEVC